MPTERDSGSAESTSFIGRIDAESKRLAKQLNELQLIYAFYGFLDGLSLGYSTLSFYFSVFYPETDFGSSSDTMHDWVITPTGAAAAASETIALAVFALLANLIEDKEEDTFKKFLAFAWSVTRDSAKALKNGYKGIRSTLQAVSVLSGHDLRYMIVPVGLAFGIVSLLHRFWFRKYVKEPRLDMTRENGKILLGLKQTRFYRLEAFPAAEEMEGYKNSYILVGDNLHYITGNGLVDEVKIRDRDKFFSELAPFIRENELMFSLSDKNAKQLITDNSYTDADDIANESKGYASLGGLHKAVCKEYRDTLRKQKEQLSESLNKRSIIGASFSGVVDGLYIYMGAVGLTALTPPVFIAMTIFSAFFASVCVVIRGYEEYDYQRRFKATQAKVELALCCKELEALFGSLQRLSDPFRRSKLSNNELVMLFNEVAIDTTESPRDLTDVDEQERRTYVEGASALQAQLDAAGPEVNVVDLRERLLDKLKSLYQLELIAKQREFSTKRRAVSSLVTASNLIAVLTGIRHGLAAYSAITALMFAFATIEAMFLTPFSPAVLLAGVMIGMVCLAICLVHSIVSVVSKPNQIAETGALRLEDVGGNLELFTLLVELKNPRNTIQDKPPYEIKKAALGGADVNSSPRALIWERFEVFRSLGSGFVKGPKLIALFYSILVSSNEGEHDTPVLFRIAIVGALLQAVVFAGRALARGLGKDAPDAPLDDADRSQGDRGGVLPEGGEGTLPPSLPPAPAPPPPPPPPLSSSPPSSPSSPSHWVASFFSSTSKGATPISCDSSAAQPHNYKSN